MRLSIFTTCGRRHASRVHGPAVAPRFRLLPSYARLHRHGTFCSSVRQLNVWAASNKAAKNICVQVCVGMFSQVNILGMELVGHTITCQLFKNCFPKSSCTILPSPLAVYEDSDFSTSLPIFFLTYTFFLFIDFREKDINLFFHLFMHSHWLILLCALTGD